MVIHRLSLPITATLVLLSAAAVAQPLPLDRIRLPAGFTIDVVARIPSARQMTFGANGTLFVGSSRGSVYAIELRAADLAFYDSAASRWQVEPITYTVHVGPSSRDLPLNASFNVSN